MARTARTAKQRAALRKAQLASARKRKGRKRHTRLKVLGGAAILGTAVFGYKSVSRYREAKQFHNQVNERSYSYPEHVYTQSVRRAKARRTFARQVKGIALNQPMNISIRRSPIKNQYANRLDAATRTKRLKAAVRGLKAGYDNYYTFELE